MIEVFMGAFFVVVGTFLLDTVPRLGLLLGFLGGYVMGAAIW